LKWLEISLTLTGEVAEAAVEVISRFTPNSIAMEYPLENNELDPKAQVLVRAYLEQNPDLETTRKSIEEGLWHLSQIINFDPPEFSWIEEEHWEQAWKEHYQPIQIGERLLIQPAWLPVQPSERIPIFIDPGMAFGTGTHPTTQLCLLALEKYLSPGQSVVDLGCGSGILSIAAALLGASEVLALDIDPNAITNAYENVKKNSLEGKIIIQLGSLDKLIAQEEIRESSCDLILANILSKVLIELIENGLGEAVRPDGLLILSGILDHQAENVIQAAQAHNIDHLETNEIEDWRSLVLKRNSPH
jgi:ribosomal protein L11 methyltransferase